MFWCHGLRRGSSTRPTIVPFLTVDTLMYNESCVQILIEFDKYIFRYDDLSEGAPNRIQGCINHGFAA
jgi:hypothetical protein